MILYGIIIMFSALFSVPLVIIHNIQFVCLLPVSIEPILSQNYLLQSKTLLLSGSCQL